jgi:hypothetical protein
MACNFKFRQGTPPACAALSAYWLGLMQEGVRDAKDREGWLRLYKPSGASEKQRVYENACFTTTSVDQGALRTAYAPLANRGFQVRAPTKHPKLNDKAISDLVLYITKNRGSGVLFTFAFSETVLGYAFRHTHTVAFWSEKDAIYLFDAGDFTHCGGAGYCPRVREVSAPATTCVFGDLSLAFGLARRPGVPNASPPCFSRSRRKTLLGRKAH